MSKAASTVLFGEVVVPHLSDALSLARWLTGNKADAEDVVQEACLKAYAGLGGFSGGNSRAWMLTIVRNASYTWLLRNRTKNVVAVGNLDDLDQLASANDKGGFENCNAEATLIEKANTAELEKAISVLPQQFREALVMRDITGLSYREIATIMEVPIGTVMSRLARARSLLASQLRRGS
ncbi:MAG: sigma-70 family RNA polymerase sigma factor [Aestuariivirga sp.]